MNPLAGMQLPQGLKGSGNFRPEYGRTGPHLIWLYKTHDPASLGPAASSPPMTVELVLRGLRPGRKRKKKKKKKLFEENLTDGEDMMAQFSSEKICIFKSRVYR